MDTGNREVTMTESGCRRPLRKHLFWIVPAALAVLLAAGWFGVQFAVESTAKRCLADASLRLIGGEVELDELFCSLIDQELCIKGIRVKNPPGYSQEYAALEVDLIRVRVNPLAFLFERVVHLNKLTVSGISINVELKKTPMDFNDCLKLWRDREINLLELKKAAPVSERSAGKRKNRSGSRRQKAPLKFRIDELRVEKAAATLHNYTLIPESWRTITLNSYVQKDLGRDVPLTADELAREIFNRHWNDIQKYVRNSFKDMKDKARDWWEKHFGKKPKKETPAATPAPPARSEDEAAKKKKKEARKQLLKSAGRAAADLAGAWLKKKQKQMEEAPGASGDPEEDSKARRNKLLVDLGVQAADAVREELAEPPPAPVPEPAESGRAPAPVPERKSE